MVERDDVVDALATYIAHCVLAHPNASRLKPEQVQSAIGTALGELQKGTARRIWDWGRVLYRCGAMSYGAFSVFSSPWVAKMILTALFGGSRYLLSILLM
mmetsp:Transcript_10566/g.34735  ORF Transcript_10566/g.34735 Transcript_10566/m.34735 type:complete len:100 (-) Transcript_10566:48-347(-)